MSKGQDYLWQIAMTLQHHGIIERVTEGMIEQADNVLRKLAAKEGDGPVEMVLSALDVMMTRPPERCIAYDTEYVDCGAEYADLVRLYARATLGEWRPEHISARRIPIREGLVRETIDFDSHGQHFHWEFEADGSDWVEYTFVELIDEFCTSHLSGAFLPICESMQTQGVLFYYLPHRTIADLNAIVEQMQQEYTDLAAFAEAL